jgi:aryl-alcohol dehydrogenase-like predicted oxidoreductase
MEHVRLGQSNLMVSRIGFGAMGIGDRSWRSWVTEEREARGLVEAALELGIDFFDTCDYYSAGESERILGRTLLDMVPREQVVIATKVGNPMGPGANSRGYSRKHIFDAVDASLRRLGTDYIDLYQTHIWQTDTYIEETIAAFNDLVRAGKVRYVGATDMPVWQFAKFIYTARLTGRASFVSMQCHYNLVWRGAERELIPMCESEGVGLLPYSPLARGFLAAPAGHDRDTERARTDALSRHWYGRDCDRQVAETVYELARRRDTTPAAIALAWVLAKSPNAAPLIGPTDRDHLAVVEQAMACQLDDGEMETLESGYQARLAYQH